MRRSFVSVFVLLLAVLRCSFAERRIAVLSSSFTAVQWLGGKNEELARSIERLAEQGLMLSGTQTTLLKEAVADLDASSSGGGDIVLLRLRESFLRFKGEDASLACVDAADWGAALFEMCAGDEGNVCSAAEFRVLQQLVHKQWCAPTVEGGGARLPGNTPRALVEAGEAAKAKIRSAARKLVPEKCDATCEEFEKECEKCMTLSEIDAVTATFMAKLSEDSTVDSKPALDLDETNEALAHANATEVIRFAVERFGERTAVTTSFGVQSALMLHLATSVKPDIPVIWVDTGYLPPETYTFARDLTKRLNLNLHIFQSEMTPARMEATLGPKLWETDHQAYGRLRKVQPMARALSELAGDPVEHLTDGAWDDAEVDDEQQLRSAPCVLTALRKSQTVHRGGLRRVNLQQTPRPHYKVCPVLDWSKQDVDAYLVKHNLPYHPLKAHGYSSVGDAHSSAPVSSSHGGSELAERASRFGGRAQECGLHVENVLDKTKRTKWKKR